MSSHREYLELAEMSVLGRLEAADQARLDEHLSAGCEECRRAMREAAMLADELAGAIPAMDVSPEVRERLLDRVRAESEARPPAPPIRWQSYALAASLITAMVLGVRLFQLSGELDAKEASLADAVREYQAERTDLGHAIAQLESQARDRARLEQELASLRGTVGALTAANTQTVPLAGQGPMPDASARAYLDPETRRLILYVYDLAPAAAGKSYQLWVIADGKPVSAGVLELDPGGATQYDTIASSKLESGVTIAVTLEPEGGRDQPSGPIVLAGK